MAIDKLVIRFSGQLKEEDCSGFQRCKGAGFKNLHISESKVIITIY